MDLLLIRHGESFANTERVFSNSGWKHGLTPKGFEQAKSAAMAIPAFFGEPARIYSSHLKRACETAGVIAEQLGVEHRALAELGEIAAGDLEGKSDARSWNIHNNVWNRWFQLGDTDARLPGGETMQEAVGRMMTAIARIEEEEEGRKFAIVSHGGIIMALLLSKVYGLPDFIQRRGLISNCDMVHVAKKDGMLLYRGFKSGKR